MLKISNLTLSVEDKTLFNNLNLDIDDNTIYVLLGKNGVGKSSIAKAIMGDSSYKVDGSIIYNDVDIVNKRIDERANMGIYYLNQSPISIEGVTNAEMLRTVLNQRSDKPVNIYEFNKELENICDRLELDRSFIHKEINVGASGGERKKIELMHMWMLKPSFIILDEIDSGLDVDAVKIVSKSLKEYYDLYKPIILIITHNKSLIDTFDSFKTIVFENNSVELGNKELANKILTEGFKTKTNEIREN